MPLRGWRLAALLLVPLLGAPWCARALEFGEGPILLIADEVDYDQTTGIVTAEGDVEITRQDRRLLADRVRYDQRADVVTAIGNVVLLEPTGETLFADEVRLTGDLAEGVVEELRVRLPDDSKFAATRGRRTGGTRVDMERVVYSPCEVCPDSTSPPLWQITAERVVHDQEARTISYRNAFLEMLGVPVAYTPYFSHPDPTVERKSGFLAPTISGDSELGFGLETPYYFALAPDHDLTLAPIVFTEENPALLGEYRHLLPAGRFGLSASATYASAAIDDEPTDNKAFRGHLDGEGVFGLGNDWRTGYELEVASDDTYLERYDFSEEDVLENRLFVERIWERNYLTLNGYGFQDLRSGEEQGLVPIALPLARAALETDPLWNGSRLTLDSSALALTRTDGLDTRRLSTTGGYEIPWLGPLGDRSRLRLSLRGDVYHTDGDPQTLQDDGSDTETRLFPRATFDWGWPLVGEVLGTTSVIEPVVNATFAPTGLNDDDIPNEDSLDLEFDDTNLFDADRFPGLDRVDEGGKISYGLRFTSLGESGELLDVLFGQSYRFYGEDIFAPETGLDDDLSDYVGRVQFSPDPWLNVRYRFRLDRNAGALLRNEVRAVVGPPRVRFNATYLSLEDDPASEELREREEITAGILLGLTPAVALRAQTRRNLTEDQFIAHKFGLIYRNPCLLLVAALEKRFTEDRDAGSGLDFMVRVTLQNIGEFAASASMLGS